MSILHSRFGKYKFIFTLNGMILLELDLVEDPLELEVNPMRISLNWVNILVHCLDSAFSMSFFVLSVACLLSISLAILDLVMQVDK